MRKVVEFDEFSRCCQYFKSSEDYDFECLHPEQEERENYNGRELGRCFSCSCPLGIEAEQEDYGTKDIKKCDRCGEYYDKNVRQSYILAKEQILSDNLEMFDLCSHCTAELEEWFNSKKIEKIKENS